MDEGAKKAAVRCLARSAQIRAEHTR